MTLTTLFAQAANPRPDNCSAADCAVNLPGVTASEGQISSGLAVIFGTFAAVAVVVIIVAAIDFVNSSGEPEKISRAKKTIIFALIGLVISLSAEAVVLTILNRL